MKTRIKINALALAAAFVVCAFFPHLFLRNSEGRFDDFLEVSGFALILLGFLLRASARGYKAEHSANGNSLVTGGPYSLVRNPMYLGIIVAGVGIILVIGKMWALLIFLVGFLLRYLYLFRKEEAALERLFGNAYRQYLKKVPRLLPGAFSFFRRDVREYLSVKTAWFRSELISIVPVMLAVVVFESWEAFGFGGWSRVGHSLLLFSGVIVAFIALVKYLTVSNESPPSDCDRNGKQ